MKLDNNQQAFMELLRAGLWEKEAQLATFKKIDYQEVIRLAEEQSVTGLIAAGLDHIANVKAPQEVVFQFIGCALQLEQRNVVMNEFVAKLIGKLRNEDIYALLVKGQGIAQCYEKPLWRTSGDVDLLLSEDCYERAKEVLLPIAIDIAPEFKSLKHVGMTMEGGFVVELHGILHSRLSKRVDRVVDEVQKDVFIGGNVRSWNNKGTTIFLPSADNDVIFVFTHILKHFYIEGIGLRQICDWCRILYIYRESLNRGLLESRIRRAGLLSEWNAFAALAVFWLGMPSEAMPLYEVKGNNMRWKKKAEKIMEFIIECGNFGQNREIKRSQNFMIGKVQALLFKMRDFVRHARIFPLDSIMFFSHYVKNGILVAKEIRDSKGILA